VSFGARYDRERRDANIVTGFAPPIGAPDTLVDERRTFSDVSPQVAIAVNLRPGSILFGSASRAFKAGGFNPVAIPGSEVYDEEHAWNFEGGVKTGTANGRFTLTATVFSIDWSDLQLNLAIPGAPGQFYIDNVGAATSRGVEFEVMGRVSKGLDLFGGVGTTRALFDSGVMLNGADLSDNKIPNTPAFTTTIGAQYSKEMRPGHRLYGRLEVVTTGAFEYDENNTQRQDAYTLTNVRAGVTFKRVFVEGWVRNAFDTRYVPLAFAYPGFTPSGFLGEPGRPRTWGINVGIGF
jgi:iron complex outermembrane receptor protein